MIRSIKLFFLLDIKSMNLLPRHNNIANIMLINIKLFIEQPIPQEPLSIVISRNEELKGIVDRSNVFAISLHYAFLYH